VIELIKDKWADMPMKWKIGAAVVAVIIIVAIIT